ncbi:MAG TPA: sulfur carrier protein ThiS [Nitrospiria bacterium]|nr:sulfur carrier protein ThiS [Nitrospiria bacterium]
MIVTLNGTRTSVGHGITVADLLAEHGIARERVAVEVNLVVIDRNAFERTTLHDGDRVEVVSFVGGGMDERLRIGPVELRSRLIVGTGKFKDFAETKRVIDASGADMVTVAVRRVNILDRASENLLDYLNPKEYHILPNTAGCYTAEEAIRTARLARAAGISDLVKLEVIGDQRTLFPDNEALLDAAKVLVKEGFVVLPYTTDDPIMAKKLQDVGCAAVMPLAAPIGSGLGIRNPYNLRIIRETVAVPVIVDAGVGTASDAAIAMELGCSGVLMNTGIAGAKHPLLMAEAMRDAVRAGRLAYLAGRIPKKLYATASSPLDGLLE